ncbi:MAG: hypothetical protein WDZ31_06150 [Phycisphaeraceae bacterium]
MQAIWWQGRAFFLQSLFQTKARQIRNSLEQERKPMFRTLLMSLTLTSAMLAASTATAQALDGFAVTSHGAFGDHPEAYQSKPGVIVRHEIRDGEVTSSSEIHAGPARVPTISPDGEQVAFLKASGIIAVMPAEGGPVKDLVQANPGSHIDFAADGWIYYNLGSWTQDTSRRFRRVNANTGEDERVAEIEGTRVWRFQVTNDGESMMIGPLGGIYVYDLVKNDGHLGAHNEFPGLPRYKDNMGACQGGLSSSGRYLLAGNEAHSGVHIIDWETREEAATVLYRTYDGRTPTPWFTYPVGTKHGINGFSTNSDEWLMVRLITDDQGPENAGNVVLVNWARQQMVPLTHHEFGDGLSDHLGDLWVEGHSPGDPVDPLPDRNDLSGLLAE